MAASPLLCAGVHQGLQPTKFIRFPPMKKWHPFTIPQSCLCPSCRCPSNFSPRLVDPLLVFIASCYQES